MPKPIEMGSQGAESNPLDPKNFEGLDLNTRCSKQRLAVIEHYRIAYENLENASHDPNELAIAIGEFIDDKSLFEATHEEKRAQERAEDAGEIVEGALEESMKRWRESTIKDTIAELQNAGKVDSWRKE